MCVSGALSDNSTGQFLCTSEFSGSSYFWHQFITTQLRSTFFILIALQLSLGVKKGAKNYSITNLDVRGKIGVLFSKMLTAAVSMNNIEFEFIYDLRSVWALGDSWIVLKEIWRTCNPNTFCLGKFAKFLLDALYFGSQKLL